MDNKRKLVKTKIISCFLAVMLLAGPVNVPAAEFSAGEGSGVEDLFSDAPSSQAAE